MLWINLGRRNLEIIFLTEPAEVGFVDRHDLQTSLESLNSMYLEYNQLMKASYIGHHYCQFMQWEKHSDNAQLSHVREDY